MTTSTLSYDYDMLRGSLTSEYAGWGERTVLNANWTTHTDPAEGSYSFSISFQGLMRDVESGLIYNRARMRHAQLGRWMQREPLGYVNGMSLYQYVASNPLSYYVDPTGREIEIQTHPAFGAWDHCSLKITPENQDRWSGHIAFDKGPDGKWYTTLGGEKRKGKLFSANLRESDDATARNENAADRCPLSPPLDEDGEPIDEDEWIDSLLNADNNYQDNAPYNPSPERSPGSFNSNSYISGILQATGTPFNPKAPCKKWEGGWPGWGDPLPKPYFEPPRPQQ